MSTVNFPHNFGQRQCDRKLVLALRKEDESLTRGDILWMMFLVWQDFANAREDRRLVPASLEARANSAATEILEEFIDWRGARGRFIESAIQEGFFLLVGNGVDELELVLVDFLPANAAAATVSNSARGGTEKSFNRIKANSEAAASDQLQLFEATGLVAIEGVAPSEMKASARLIHQICLALRWKTPESEDWKNSIMSKAAVVIRNTAAQDRDDVIRWLILNKTDAKIPKRIDFMLDAFPTFIPEARTAFAR